MKNYMHKYTKCQLKFETILVGIFKTNYSDNVNGRKDKKAVK